VLPGLRKGPSSKPHQYRNLRCPSAGHGRTACLGHLTEVYLTVHEAKLRHFKKQAKVLLKGVQNGDRAALSEAGLHPRFPSQMEPVDFKLSDAHLVIARQQGFAGWTQLKAAINVMDTPTGALPMKMNYLTPELPV
jgi:hypothetical protein